jgi:DNA-binding FadR family transcriptional regulator
MEETLMTEPYALTPQAEPQKRKRSDQVAEAIRLWITQNALSPGDKLPQEPELARHFGVSKGTMREALKALEVQGLVRVRTGPGGGASVSKVPQDRATELLSNYFYGRSVSLTDIYAVRKELEPKLARAVCGKLSAADLDGLETHISFCSCEPVASPIGHAQRLSELDFHDILADACPNHLLGFFCRFINGLLKNLAVCRDIYAAPQHELSRRCRHFHMELVAAFKAEDAEQAEALMHAHMIEAERLMLDNAGEIVENHFLVADDFPTARSA